MVAFCSKVLSSTFRPKPALDIPLNHVPIITFRSDSFVVIDSVKRYVLSSYVVPGARGRSVNKKEQSVLKQGIGILCALCHDGRSRRRSETRAEEGTLRLTLEGSQEKRRVLGLFCFLGGKRGGSTTTRLRKKGNWKAACMIGSLPCSSCL